MRKRMWKGIKKRLSFSTQEKRGKWGLILTNVNLEWHYWKQQIHRGEVSHALIWTRPAGKKKEGRKEGKERSTLAPTPSDSWRSTSTCLSSEQAIEEASLWWRIGPVHVQIRAQRPVSLIDIDFFEALHLNHLQKTRDLVIYLEKTLFTTQPPSLVAVDLSGLGIQDVNDHLYTLSYTY